jgi:hypothetical protein
MDEVDEDEDEDEDEDSLVRMEMERAFEEEGEEKGTTSPLYSPSTSSRRRRAVADYLPAE